MSGLRETETDRGTERGGKNRGREEKKRRVFDYFIDGFQLLVDPR
jgi:hypothetical protein